MPIRPDANTSRPDYEVIEADTAELRQACIDVRIEEQGFSMEDELDDHDSTAIHFLLNLLQPNDSGEMGRKRVPIGTIRVIPEQNRIGRLAISKEYRSYGFGRVLMERVFVWARYNAKRREQDPSKVRLMLHSQIYAIPFYEKCGYHPIGEQFDEDGAMHQEMIQDIRADS